MSDLILMTVIFAILYGLTWHDQPARTREPGEPDNQKLTPNNPSKK
jgi:hypothetical protein